MKTSKPNSLTFCLAASVTIAVALSVQLAGQTAVVKPPVQAVVLARNGAYKWSGLIPES